MADVRGTFRAGWPRLVRQSDDSSRWEPYTMRRFAFACLCLVLSGCGYNTWWNAPFTSGSNPNMPAGTSENMRRVTGEQVDTAPLNPEPGDIWPGPVQAIPSLQELEQQGLQSGPEQPVPGSPESQGNAPTPYTPPPPPKRGSSTPPAPIPPTTAPPQVRPAPPVATVPPPAQNPGGQLYQTQKGPGVTGGGTTGYQTLTTPGGGSAIVVPNGNGTSTIIHSDGSIETVPTPR